MAGERRRRVERKRRLLPRPPASFVHEIGAAPPAYWSKCSWGAKDGGARPSQFPSSFFIFHLAFLAVGAAVTLRMRLRCRTFCSLSVHSASSLFADEVLKRRAVARLITVSPI
ncbi:hypothetical protein C8R43DRAFT_1143361 [Mycena crocata]|nr:hypothetical protein C8R43DRAFT_1143361 [Mycena crocata]